MQFLTRTSLLVIFLVFTVGTLSTVAHAIKVWNVNMHKTVDLPVKPLINATTITDNGTCGYDGIIAIKNVEKERIQDPIMFKSDGFLAIVQLPNDTRYLWCGLR